MDDFIDPSRIVARLELREGMKVADFGCGSGFLAFEAIKRVGQSGKVYAIDVQKDILDGLTARALHEKIENLEVIWGDFDEKGGTTLADESQDAVIVSNVLFQSKAKSGLAFEAFRVVKAGGKVVVVDWKESEQKTGPAREHIVPIERARALFSGAGFSEVESFELGSHHYGLLFKK